MRNAKCQLSDLFGHAMRLVRQGLNHGWQIRFSFSPKRCRFETTADLNTMQEKRDVFENAVSFLLA